MHFNTFIYKLISLLIFIVNPCFLYSANFPSQNSLGEFNYGMTADEVKKLSFPLLQKGELDDGELYKAYLLDKNSETYVVFSFTDYRKNQVYGIQITGNNKKQKLFAELKFGQTKNEVFKLLGSPADSKFVEATSGVNYSFFNRNYSVEFNSIGRLHSVAIKGDKGLLIAMGWDENWENYEPNSLKNLIDKYFKKFVEPAAFTIYGSYIKFRPKVFYTGESRPLNKDTKSIIEMWIKSLNLDPSFIDYFTKEIKVTENGESYWIAIQDVLLETFYKDVSSDAFNPELFLIMIGQAHNSPVFICNEYIIW